MNFEKIVDLVKNPKLKDPIKKMLEFEHSHLHLKEPRYTEPYNQIIEEAINENK